MTMSDKNKIKDTFFKVKAVCDKSPLMHKEIITALRIKNVINSNALENAVIDPIFFNSALYRGSIKLKEFSNPAYRKAFLEVKSHDKMLRFLETKAHRKTELTISLLLKIHRILFEESWPDIAGRFRDINVRIRGVSHRPPHFANIYEIIYQHLTWIDGLIKLLGPVSHDNFFEIFHVAADIQRRVIQTYPFRAGNWRIARALTDFILLYTGMTYVVIDYKKYEEYLTAINKSTITDFTALEDFLLKSYGETLERINSFAELSRQSSKA